MRSLLALLACAALTAGAAEKEKTEHRTRIRLGGVSIGAGYSRFSGYPWYPGYGWYPGAFYGGYSPLWYPPFWGFDAFFHPGYWSGFARGPNLGEIQLKTERKDAEVFIDGAYAGEAKDRRSMWLEPGAYDLELRAGEERFERRIFVLSGKTLRISAELKEAKP